MQVSVVCPVFNTDTVLLQKAVDSVLVADNAVLRELILVDDASTDQGTVAALATIGAQDARVRLIRNVANSGQSASRGFGVAAATSEWIGFLDADDLWMAQKLESIEKVLREFPNAQWIAGNHLNGLSDGSVTAATKILETGIGTQITQTLWRLSGPDLVRVVIGNAWLHLGVSVMKKSLLEAARGFRPEFIYMEDYHIFCKLAALAELYYLDEPFYVWRRHNDGVTGSTRRLGAGTLEAYRALRRDPMLQDYRRETRWAFYNATKGLALNNLLSGFRLRALRFALEAFATDPREIGDLARFLRLMRLQDVDRMAQQGIAYSRAEQLIVRRPA